MQHNTSGTAQYSRQIQFQIPVNLSKWYIKIILVKMVVGILITQTQKVWWLQLVAFNEDSCHRNVKPSTLPFVLSSVYYHYFHLTFNFYFWTEAKIQFNCLYKNYILNRIYNHIYLDCWHFKLHLKTDFKIKINFKFSNF